MVSFRKKFIESEIPASLPTVVQKLIPSKGIKRKNKKGYELLDLVCLDDAHKDDYQNLFNNLLKSQINFAKESDGESSLTTAPMKFFKMKAWPPSLMNLRLWPLVHALFL